MAKQKGTWAVYDYCVLPAVLLWRSLTDEAHMPGWHEWFIYDKTGKIIDKVTWLTKAWHYA